MKGETKSVVVPAVNLLSHSLAPYFSLHLCLWLLLNKVSFLCDETENLIFLKPFFSQTHETTSFSDPIPHGKFYLIIIKHFYGTFSCQHQAQYTLTETISLTISLSHIHSTHKQHRHICMHE